MNLCYSGMLEQLSLLTWSSTDFVGINWHNWGVLLGGGGGGDLPPSSSQMLTGMRPYNSGGGCFLSYLHVHVASIEFGFNLKDLHQIIDTAASANF
jgi:hypothetical protein